MSRWRDEDDADSFIEDGLQPELRLGGAFEIAYCSNLLSQLGAF